MADSRTPSETQLLAIVQAARSAPSGDNLQPFRYRWRQDRATLEIVFCPARAAHVLDVAGHASRLTLGMILASIRLAAEAEGLAAEVRIYDAARALDPTPTTDATWASLTFCGATPRRDPLLDALPLRHTDRRVYRPATAAAAARDALPTLRRALPPLAGEQCAIHLAEPGLPALQRWIRRADADLWRAPAIPEDALRWVRFDPRALAEHGEGVSFRNLGLPPLLAAGVAVARSAPVALRLGAHLGGPLLTARLLASQLESSAALVLVTTRGPRPDALVEAGDAALRAWVALAAAGWSAQPLTLGPILTMATRDGRLDPAIPRNVGERALAGFADVRSALGLPTDAWPAFLLRAGPNAPLPQGLRPPRRPLAAILERTA